MAGLCEGGKEPPGSLKAINVSKEEESRRELQRRDYSLRVSATDRYRSQFWAIVPPPVNSIPFQGSDGCSEEGGVSTVEETRRKVVAPLCLVSVMEWTKVERALAAEAYFSDGRSIIAMQRAFRTHFNIAPCGHVPGQQSGKLVM
ncbi:hypothetical protein ANN_04306 [Periplaneta americana]|uniref:DUF4817 domain-containing protein n=1 Tax=Periplaneta americana TaxID=6978 RepID=A0ABQ8TA35_PERAM|nr:hypothetical protein ANN_04306 [Periplaneta americana]